VSAQWTTGRTWGRCLLVVALVLGCGAPGKSRLLQKGHEDAGDDPGNSDDSDTSAPAVDAAGRDLRTAAGASDALPADGPVSIDTGCPPGSTCACGGIGQPCCNGSDCTSDGNPCNGDEVCVEKTCQHQNPVICTAMDACHGVGVCQPADGTCTNPPRTGSCDDQDPCTQNDSCQSGLCKGTPLSCGTGQRCSNGACVCDPATCSSGKTCVNTTCVACGALNQPCCNGGCNGGLSCSSGTCKTTCDSRMGQACDTNTCSPGKYDCSGRCANKTAKNCGTTQACDPTNGLCMPCGERYGLCCTAAGVQACHGPEDFCFTDSSKRKVCWITGHISQFCIPGGICKQSLTECIADTCVCMQGEMCATWTDDSGMTPKPP
jgi:hypothetical protein